MKSKVKIFIVTILVVVLIIPLLVWWPAAKSVFDSPVNSSGYLSLLFPLFGLYALVLVWIQFMVGALRDLLNNYFEPDKILRYHIREGIVAYSVTLLHPLFLYVSIRLMGDTYLGLLNSLATPLKLYWSVGIIAFLLLTVAALAGVLRRNKFVVRHWKKVHYLTYIALPLILYHSWKIGSHVQNTAFAYLWYGFTGTYIVAALYRLNYHIKITIAKRQARLRANSAV